MVRTIVGDLRFSEIIHTLRGEIQDGDNGVSYCQNCVLPRRASAPRLCQNVGGKHSWSTQQSTPRVIRIAKTAHVLGRGFSS